MAAFSQYHWSAVLLNVTLKVTMKREKCHMKHVLIPSEENLQTSSIQTFSQLTHGNFIPQSWFSKHITTSLTNNITLLMDPIITVKH